jgi:hypothetical protein
MNGNAPIQFGLSTMFVATTIVAVLMSITVMLPPLGIVLFVLSLPAAIRSYVLVLQYRRSGYVITATQQALLFFSCLSVAWLIFLVSAVPFGVAFIGGAIVLYPLLGMLGGFVGGAIGGLAVLYMLMRRWFKWPATKPGESFGWLLRIPDNRPPERNP